LLNTQAIRNSDRFVADRPGVASQQGKFVRTGYKGCPASHPIRMGSSFADCWPLKSVCSEIEERA